MNYELYWSVLDTPAKSIRAYDILLYTSIISFVLFFIIKIFKKSMENIEKKILLWSVGVFFILSISSFFYLKIYDNDEGFVSTQKALSSNNVKVVEGKINNFKRIYVRGRRGVIQESFNVDEVYFSYSSELLAGFHYFNKTNNGIFHDGLQVRITYGKEKNTILKIEIAK